MPLQLLDFLNLGIFYVYQPLWARCQTRMRMQRAYRRQFVYDVKSSGPIRPIPSPLQWSGDRWWVGSSRATVPWGHAETVGLGGACSSRVAAPWLPHTQATAWPAKRRERAREQLWSPGRTRAVFGAVRGDAGEGVAVQRSTGSSL